MTASDEVKSKLEGMLRALLERGRVLLASVDELIGEISANDDEWKALLERLHASSSRIPFRPFNRFYYKDLQPAREPLFGPLPLGELNEQFGEMSDDYLAEIRSRFQSPAEVAVGKVFDNIADYFRELSAKVLTLRFFSNSEELLKKFEAALAPPWAEQVNLHRAKTNYILPGWVGGAAVSEEPPHLVIAAVRSAFVATLRILRHKLLEMVATLETAIVELPFAEKLSDPKPVPQTLIDYSTHIGDGASIRDAAIGQSAARQR